MVRELGAIIRNQVPSGRKSVLEAYGEILYRAWRESTAACLLEVENQVQVTDIPSSTFMLITNSLFPICAAPWYLG